MVISGNISCLKSTAVLFLRQNSQFKLHLSDIHKVSDKGPYERMGDGLENLYFIKFKATGKDIIFLEWRFNLAKNNSIFFFSIEIIPTAKYNRNAKKSRKEKYL